MIGILTLLLLIGSLMSVLFCTRLLHNHAVDHQPRCACCGYIVRGLRTRICPECGSNLNAIGIRQRWRFRTAGIVCLIASWLALGASSGFLALSVLAVKVSHLLPIECPQQWYLSSLKGGLGRVRIWLSEFRNNGDKGELAISLLDFPEIPAAVLVQLDRLTFKDPNKAQRTFAPEEFTAWLAGNGSNVNDVVQEDVYELVKLATDLSNGCSLDKAAARLTGFDCRKVELVGSPPPWYWPSAIVIWVIMCSMGMYLCLRRVRAWESERRIPET